MSIIYKINKFMHQAVEMDERYCLCCNEKLNELDHYLFDDKNICQTCRSKFKLHQQVYLIDGAYYHILYEYDDFLERLFFQFKEQNDIVLSSVFLEDQDKLIRKLNKYCLCALCSSEKKRATRAFEPILEIFPGAYSPFYKLKDVKQSALSPEKRKQISNVIMLKHEYRLDQRELMIIDDVLTTGSTIKTALSLLPAKNVFVLAAHPLWIQANQENMVVKSHWF